MKHAPRIMAMVLALLLSTAAGAYATELNPPGTLPIAQEKVTLTILMQQDPMVEDYETNTFTKMIEEQTNIDLDFELLPPGTEGLNKLSVMIASGQTLPDIINVSLPEDTILQYAQSGAIIPLDDFYDSVAVKFPGIVSEYPEFDIVKNITAADGHIYAVPYFEKALGNEVKYRAWINKVWLDNLGLDVPETTEELYAALKAFKENDPNGNGLQDEYPMVGATGWSQNPLVYLMNAFVNDNDGDRLLVDTNGKLYVPYTTDQWRQGLEYIRSLVDESLVSPLSFTQDDAQLRAMVANEDACIVGAFTFAGLSLMLYDNPYFKDYVALPPVAGPDGVRLTSYTPTLPTQRWFVTADCKEPELAFRLGDFLFDEDIWFQGRYGVFGENWGLPEEGAKSAWANLGPAFELAKYEALGTYLWNVSQNTHWRVNAPTFAYHAPNGEMYPVDGDNRLYEAIIELLQNYLPSTESFVNKLVLAEEETQHISEIRATLKSYVNESSVNFVTRNLNLDAEWNKYLAELDRIGLQTFLEVCQTAYDRMQEE